MNSTCHPGMKFSHLFTSHHARVPSCAQERHNPSSDLQSKKSFLVSCLTASHLFSKNNPDQNKWLISSTGSETWFIFITSEELKTACVISRDTYQHKAWRLRKASHVWMGGEEICYYGVLNTPGLRGQRHSIHQPGAEDLSFTVNLLNYGIIASVKIVAYKLETLTFTWPLFTATGQTALHVLPFGSVNWQKNLLKKSLQKSRGLSGHWGRHIS